MERAPSSSYQPQDLDLDLKSLWFAKSPVTLPPSIVGTGKDKKIYASSSGWSSSGARKTHTYNTVVQDNKTLARTKINLTWDASNPSVTVKAKQKHIPPPRKLDQRELEAYRQNYSDAVATWCESNMGRQVGDGECWTLANEGLKAVATNCNSYGTEPCMPSQSYIHGSLIYTFIPASSSYPEPQGGVFEAGVARGDVVQVYKGIFKSKDGRRSQFAGDPDHTAVVTSVETNGVLRVVESNVGGSKNVREGSYNMEELVKGEVRIFRAVGVNWLGKLDPSW